MQLHYLDAIRITQGLIRDMLELVAPLLDEEQLQEFRTKGALLMEQFQKDVAEFAKSQD